MRVDFSGESSITRINDNHSHNTPFNEGTFSNSKTSISEDSIESLSPTTSISIPRLRGGFFFGNGGSGSDSNLSTFQSICRGVAMCYSNIWTNILYVYDAIYYKFEKLFATPEMINETVDVGALQTRYDALGSDQWKENIDAYAHPHGKFVFDHALHGGCSEPGFLGGILRGQHFVREHLGQKTTTDMMMSLHKVICAHFKGTSNNVLMGWEKVGVFRDVDDHLSWHISNVERYEISDGARADLAELEVADFQPYSEENGTTTLRYRTMARDAVENKIQGYLDTYYSEISVAETRREKLTAIGKFYRNCSWTHTTRDGSGRLDMMLLQKHLCENGLPGAFLEYPYRSSTLSFEDWIDYLELSITNWETAVRERNGE